jgi:5'-nucleotidase
MLNPAIVLLDQDGPLADYHGAVCNLLAEQGFDPSLYRYSGDTLRDVAILYGHQAAEVVERARLSETFYANLRPVEGARSGVNQLLDQGHQVFVCTKPLIRSHFCSGEKVEWLRQWFPALAESVLLVPDKTLVQGDILVDDKPRVSGLRQPTWQHIWFRSNQSSTAGPEDSMDGWNDIAVVERVIRR